VFSLARRLSRGRARADASGDFAYASVIIPGTAEEGCNWSLCLRSPGPEECATFPILLIGRTCMYVTYVPVTESRRRRFRDLRGRGQTTRRALHVCGISCGEGKSYKERTTRHTSTLMGGRVYWVEEVSRRAGWWTLAPNREPSRFRTNHPSRATLRKNILRLVPKTVQTVLLQLHLPIDVFLVGMNRNGFGHFAFIQGRGIFFPAFLFHSYLNTTSLELRSGPFRGMWLASIHPFVMVGLVGTLLF